MQFQGPVKSGYDITEDTTIGRALYNTAKRSDVTMFLEVGTQIGGSARAIASGIQEKLKAGGRGWLHTIEAVRSRVEEAQKNLEGLPVTCHWSSTGQEDGLKRYYNKFSNEIAPENNVLEELFDVIQFDAVFLDSCVETQMDELRLCVSNDVPVILMHEPNDKCPNYDEFLEHHGYKFIVGGKDQIGDHNPMWVQYEKRN